MEQSKAKQNNQEKGFEKSPYAAYCVFTSLISVSFSQLSD